MNIKLDENIGRRGVELLKLAGHDVMTVRERNLQGARDEILFEVCAGEIGSLSPWIMTSVRFCDFHPNSAQDWLSWNLAGG